MTTEDAAQDAYGAVFAAGGTLWDAREAAARVACEAETGASWEDLADADRAPYRIRYSARPGYADGSPVHSAVRFVEHGVTGPPRRYA